MKTHFHPSPLGYDGAQLSSHFCYRRFGIAGDSVLAFIGPVRVQLSEMVDIEDVLARDAIQSDEMLNFIIEVFGLDLFGTVFLQRLFMACVQEEINAKLGRYAVRRDGDDLFYDNRKLSVSIATASPVSTLVHAALNTVGTGAPIPVSCLSEMGIDPVSLAASVLNRFSEEFESAQFARVKVNWVK